MMRHFTLTLSCLLAGSLISQAQVLVKVKTAEQRLIEAGQTYTLDLTGYFQLYPEPGPVAEFTLRTPVQTGFQELQYQTTDDNQPDYDPEGATFEFMTYQLATGGSYTHIFDPAASADNFVWTEHTINFQLLADVAPGTVGNFIEYVQENAFDRTIVHRSDFGVVQMGRYRLSDSGDFLLEAIPRKGFIEFEQTIANAQGTLAMARGSSLNTAQSEFYINLVDNSETLSTAYSVFGEVMNFDTSMPILEELGDPYVYDLSTFIGTVFQTAPLYSPFWLKPQSWLTVQEIDIPAGTAEGISYSYGFGDLDGEEGTSDEEAAYQDSWDISISNDGILEISRNDSGVALLEVTGSFGDQQQSFTIPLTGYNPDALNAFPGATIETEGYLTSGWYGPMLAETYPEITHDYHGEQLVYYTEDEDTGMYYYYIYDKKMESWIYTTVNLYPYMYIINTGNWLAYVETTGGSDENPRWFYDFAAQEWVFGL